MYLTGENIRDLIPSQEQPKTVSFKMILRLLIWDDEEQLMKLISQFKK